MIISEIYDVGLHIIRNIQGKTPSPVLLELMKFFSFIGEPLLFAIITLSIFWCFNEKKGFLLSFGLLISYGINLALKYLWRVPRPFVVDNTVGLAFAEGFSTPSGHSQGSATFYVLLVFLIFTHIKKNRVTTSIKIAVGIIIPLLIGFSRIYLGVHYPSDVLLGLFLGFLCAILLIITIPFFVKTILPLKKTIKIVITFAITLVGNIFIKEYLAVPALFFGFVTGFIMLTDSQSKISFKAHSTHFAHLLLRIIIGFGFLFFAYRILKKSTYFIPPEYEQLFRFIRYALIGFCGSYVIPAIFTRLKLISEPPTQG